MRRGWFDDKGGGRKRKRKVKKSGGGNRSRAEFRAETKFTC